MKKYSKKLTPVFDFGEIYGSDWAEIHMSQVGFTLPGWRRPFTPGELRSTFMRLQLLAALELENRRQRRERATAWEALEAAENRSEYYHRLLRLESSLGSMLQRVTA